MTNRLQLPVREAEIATALHAVRVSRPRISDQVAVVGNTELALATTAILLEHGISAVTLVANNEGQYSKLASLIGATVVKPPFSAEELSQVQSLLGGYGPDFVFVCDAESDACRLGIQLARPAGMIVLMAHSNNPISMNPNLLVFPDKRIQGSGQPDNEELHIARDLIRTGRVGARTANCG